MKINFKKTAFVPIDIQKGIINSGEFLPYSGTEIVKKNQQLLNWFIKQNSFIAKVNVEVDLFRFLGPNQDSTKLKSFQVPADFSEIILECGEYENTITPTKYTPGAFFNTQLDNHLRVRKIDTIVLSGVATSNGVYTTAIEAYQRGYKVIVLSDACSDRDSSIHQMMLENLFSKIAIVMKVDEFISNVDEKRS